MLAEHPHCFWRYCNRCPSVCAKPCSHVVISLWRYQHSRLLTRMDSPVQKRTRVTVSSKHCRQLANAGELPSFGAKKSWESGRSTPLHSDGEGPTNQVPCSEGGLPMLPVLLAGWVSHRRQVCLKTGWKVLELPHKPVALHILGRGSRRRKPGRMQLSTERLWAF